MMVWVEAAHAIGGYSVQVRFNTGETFDIDLAGKLDGEVFEPLRDETYFQKLTLNPDIETVVWPNGADLAPEFLYQLAVEQDRRAG
jgi:hypothetical protein